MGLSMCTCTFGLFFIYQSRKTSAKLLFQMGLMIVCVGLAYFGVVIDFLTILLTGYNFPYGTTISGTSIYWDSVLIWMWIAPAYVLGLYVCITLLIPQKKRYFMLVYVVLGIIYEICIFFDFEGSIVNEYPANPGENIIEGTYVVGSPVFIVLFIFTLSLITIGFGFLSKGIQSTGVLRKKYLIFALGVFMVTIFGLLEQLIAPGFVGIFIRFGFLSGYWFIYLALREEPEIPIKKPSKKEVTIEQSIFRISKRPDHITEEEVSISKERKICLVCKGDVLGFNVFICTHCEAFYCLNCAQAISNLENACWVCNAPIDETKPVKPFKKEEEAIDLELSEKPKKTPQKPK